MGKYSKMLLSILIIGLAGLVNADSNDSVLYDSYTGVPATEEQLAAYLAAGITNTCTNEVKTCDPDGWRPVDGSCNNLNHVDRGMFCTPQLKLVEGSCRQVNGTYEKRLTKSGKEFEPSRYYRQECLSVGDVLDNICNQLVGLFMEFLFADMGSTHDIRNYLVRTTWCCQERGKTDSMCAPNYINDMDNVHRFSNIRCMNMTKPMSFQNIGCVPNNTPPDRVDYTTTPIDMSSVYFFLDQIFPRIQANHSGLLKTETYDGTELPSSANETTTCTLAAAMKDDCTREVPNGLIGTNLLTAVFWLNHNYIARTLAELNPCWDNDKLFYVARDINIAVYTNIIYYELMPLLIGRQRLIDNGIISEESCHRDPYDESVIPQMAMESSYILRYFHTIQNAKLKKYDRNGNYVGTQRVTEFNLRVHYLAINSTMEHILNGITRQHGGAFDQVIDPELSEKATGRLQAALDVATYDLAKSDLFCIAPYIKYCDYCSNMTHTSFDDLEYRVGEQNLNLIKELYEDVEDVPLIVGAWNEKPIEDGIIPPIVACLIMDQLKRNLVSDRYWYERDSRPNAFTTEQLANIRDTTIASVFCNTGHVDNIQPKAFTVIDTDNAQQSCDDIPNIDLSLWKDDSCECEDEK